MAWDDNTPDDDVIDLTDDDGTVYTFRRSQIKSRQDFVNQLQQQRDAHKWITDPNRHTAPSDSFNPDSKPFYQRFYENLHPIDDLKEFFKAPIDVASSLSNPWSQGNFDYGERLGKMIMDDPKQGLIETAKGYSPLPLEVPTTPRAIGAYTLAAGMLGHQLLSPKPKLGIPEALPIDEAPVGDFANPVPKVSAPKTAPSIAEPPIGNSIPEQFPNLVAQLEAIQPKVQYPPKKIGANFANYERKANIALGDMTEEPPNTNRTVFDALTPDSIKGPFLPSTNQKWMNNMLPESFGGRDVNFGLDEPNPTMGVRDAAPLPPIEQEPPNMGRNVADASDPFASDIPFGDVSSFPTDHIIDKVASQSLDPEVHQAAQILKSGAPDISDVRTNERPTGFVARKKQDASAIRQTLDKTILESDSHALKSMGEAGTELDRLARLKDAHRDAFSGELSSRINRAAQGMTKEQLSKAIDVIEGKAQSADAKINNFVDVYNQNEKELVGLMGEAGSQMKMNSGKLAPFQARENYFPHAFEPGYFDKNKGQIISELMKEKGISQVEAERTLTQARKNNPILSDALHERYANLTGYRKDLDVIHQHYIDMADRAFTDKYMGVNDIANPESTATSLIQKIGAEAGPEAENQARQIMSQFLKHDELKVDPGVNALTKYQALSKLGLSAASNLAGGITGTAARARVSSLAGAIREAFTVEGKFEAQRLGTLQSLFRDSAQEVGYGSKMSYGNTSVENFLRTLSGLAGKREVQAIFESLKKNPESAYNRARLQELTLENPDKLLAQDKLTDMQIKTAANKFTDLTQGRQNSLDLPHNWSNSPTANVLTQFKKYAFIQSKNLKDAMILDLRHGRINGLLKLAVASGVLGEGAADIKELIRKGTIEGRPEGWMRIIDNAANAYGIGLLGDALSSATKGDPSEVLKTVAGPTVGDAADILASVGSAGLQTVGAKEGNPLKTLGRSAMRRIPIWGYQLSKADALQD